jgi:hypothetical protein
MSVTGHTVLWVPLAERMPEFWESVLLTLVPWSGRTDIIEPFVVSARCANVKDREFIYDNTGGMNREDGGYIRVTGYRITHWMPFPAPAPLSDEEVSRG